MRLQPSRLFALGLRALLGALLLFSLGACSSFSARDPLRMAVAITANLAGLFDLPSISVTRGGEPAGAFATGLLAAFVATPCTGPFMAAAMGAALLLPVAQAMLLFGAVFDPHTSMRELYACLPMLVLYPLALGMVAIGGLWLVSDADARPSAMKLPIPQRGKELRRMRCCFTQLFDSLF